MAGSHGDGRSASIDTCSAPARPGGACNCCCQWEYSAWYTAGYSSSKAPHGDGEQDKPWSQPKTQGPVLCRGGMKLKRCSCCGSSSVKTRR